jgi:hypothetical protein
MQASHSCRGSGEVTGALLLAKGSYPLIAHVGPGLAPAKADPRVSPIRHRIKKGLDGKGKH